ncbi:MAG: hypothetical protein NTY24_13515 [Mycobacterium sp.]|nr:hypothetical protein [Mycobacterium sp.]MCX6481356.1 hypothetical protein [Mycobacterium sp.]
MSTPRITRGVALLTGTAAVLGALAACSSTTEKPTESPAPSMSDPAMPSEKPTPTEKNVTPGGINPGGMTPGGGNGSFSPTVTARPAPTALPGNVITGG